MHEGETAVVANAVASSEEHHTHISSKTEGRMRSYFNSRDDWNLSKSLKNLIEQAVRDYEHRALVELLQNAHDAQETDATKGRVFIRLDEAQGPHGVLLVANTGRPFSASNFNAITDIAQSDKRPEEGIGNKGIGFKSVLQLSRYPEVYSRSALPSGDAAQAFDGYCFGFASRRDLEELLNGDVAKAALVADDIFHLCLPVALPTIPRDVAVLAQQGFATVVRLPLKSAEALAEARQQLATLADQPPVLLFLHRISQLEIDIPGEPSPPVHRRSHTELFADAQTSLATVDLGEAGTFLVAEGLVPPERLQRAIADSIAGEHISEGWQDWHAPASVAVALRLDEDLDEGRLYTHLPMGPGALAPLPAHVNAPFFAKLARVNLEDSVPLNDLLLDEVADLCARLLVSVSAGEHLSTDNRIDLVCWNGPQAHRLRYAFDHHGDPLPQARVLPLVNHTRGSLGEVFIWLDDELEVWTAPTISRRAGARLLAQVPSKVRITRLRRAAVTFAGRGLKPEAADLAAWAEVIAQDLASGPFDAEKWGKFYDELAKALPESRESLSGRRILIDDDHKLRRANSKDSDGRSAVAFFPPGSDTEGGDLRPPKKLRKRVFFLAKDIPTNRRLGAVVSKRPGRRMLEDGLINEYRATDLLPVIARALASRPEPGLALEVLTWAFRFTQGRDDPPWSDLRRMNLLVPVRSGAWVNASQAIFGRAWDKDVGGWMEDLLQRANGAAPQLARAAERLLGEPTEAPFQGNSSGDWFTFLQQLGVQQGITPQPLPRTVMRAEGRSFETVPWQLANLDPALTATWRSHLEQRRPSGLRPATRYESNRNLSGLPGQEEYDQFTPPMRLLYARLLAHGLSQWSDTGLHVEVRRYNDHTDRFTLPTPAAAFLGQDQWLPISEPGDRSRPLYTTPSEAWTHTDDAPPFATVLIPTIRRLLDATPTSRSRATRLAVRSWDDPATAGDRLALLTGLLTDGLISEGAMASFRRAYEDAWTDMQEANWRAGLDKAGGLLVVARGNRLETLSLQEGDEVVYVQDLEARQNLALLEQSKAPVLRLRGSHGNAVATWLHRGYPERIVRVSEVDVVVQVDGKPLDPADADPLIGPEREWFVDLVASTLELRSSSFRSRSNTAEGLRRSVSRLRQIRIRTCDDLQARIGDLSVGGTRGLRALALPHETHPCVLLRREPGDKPVLQRAAPLVADLLGQPEVGDSLTVSLLDLARNGWGDERPPTSLQLADAMDESPERIEEIRTALRHPDDLALEMLIPLLAVFDLPRARELDNAEDAPPSVPELISWLCECAADPPEPETLMIQVSERDLDGARRALGLSLPVLNAAIDQLGLPYQPLRDREGVEQQFAAYVSRHRASVVDALRQRYLAIFTSGQSLAEYAEARTLPGLMAPSEWVEQFLSLDERVMRDHVTAWAVTHDAPWPGALTVTLQPVTALRETNRAAVLDFTRRASDAIRAWAAATGGSPSPAPGEPVQVADALGSEGLLDFAPIAERQVLAWLKSREQWPALMPLSLDADTLGIDAADIAAVKSAAAEAERRRADERRQVRVDGKVLVAEEANYKAIADAVRAGLTPAFLSSKATGTLLDMSAAKARKPGGGGPGTTAGRRQTQSPAQAGAIGLAGEIAALGWVRHHYPDAGDDSWVSGYRNQVLGDGRGDDSLGYDLVVHLPKSRLYFEVKATSGDLTEFVLTDVEMLRAQTLKRSERYAILYVLHTLDGDLRSIHELPNPLDARYAALYRPIGEGLRYRFQLPRMDQGSE